LGKCGPLINAEYNIDITHLKITDYGNLALAKETPKPSLEDYLEKLEKKVTAVKNKKGTPIIIGGSKDVLYGGAKSLIGR
jgi:biopolymer transport protein ExbD